MLYSETDPHKIKQIIQKGKLVSLFTQSAGLILMNAENSYSNKALLSRNGILLSPPLAIIPSLEKLYEHYSLKLPIHLNLLLNLFLPGELIVIFRNQTGQKVNTYIPSIPNLNRHLGDIGNPLVGYIPFLNSFSFISTYNQMHEAFNREEARICLWHHELNYNQSGSLGVLPAVLDITDYNQPTVISPGQIGYSEIGQILPKRFKIIKNYKNFFFPESHKASFYLSNKPPRSNALAVNIGTKEKLKENFGLTVLDYFSIKQIRNQIIVNLGSQTSPRSLAANLSTNLYEASKLGIEKRLILNQKWPRNKWGEYIQHSLNILTEPVYSTQTEAEVDAKIDNLFSQLQHI